MENYKIGYIDSLETFGLVDGPGVRFVAFLKGCNLRCKYCHNPETWNGAGEKWTTIDLFNRMWKYKNYWGSDLTKGGITLSGGEPLLQIDFVTELFTIAKSHGVHTAIDTAGQPFSNDPSYLEKFNQLMKVTDLFIVDIKMFDSVKHINLTGMDNKNILDMIRYLSDNNKDMWIRRVLVPGYTDNEKDLTDTYNFIKDLNNVKRVEILPYHTLGLSKWVKLGIKYQLDGVRTPTDDEIKRAEDILHVHDFE